MHAQKKPASIWATAHFNKKEVMVGEPLVVTITVYTSTWFTQPPIFSEIQVAGTLMMKLQQRSGAKSVTIGRNQYPAIEQRFVVYPATIGENILPSFEVITNCPPEGDFKGIERTVETKERKFTVLPPPEGIDTSQWLSAYSLTLSETWDRPLKDLKAGDILERRIRVQAGGALSALIPPADIGNIDFGSIYPKKPILGNVQNKGSFTGSRTEIITYLIEKDGNFTIPGIEVPWFNLRTKTLEKQTLEPITIEVATNPDLEFILSQQKALQAELAKEETLETAVEEPFEFLGLNWWQLLLIVLAIMALLVQTYRIARKFQRSVKKRKEAKLKSEEHYFKLLKRSLDQGERSSIIRQLFLWYDRFRGTEYQPDFNDLISRSKDEGLINNVQNAAKSTYKEEEWDRGYRDPDILYKGLLDFKKTRKGKIKQQRSRSWLDLNPK